MKLEYTEKAVSEIESILSHIAQDNPPAAAAVASALRVAAARICSFPLIGAKTSEPSVHVKIARPYHYLIFYGVNNDVLTIRNVRHPASRPLIRSH